MEIEIKLCGEPDSLKRAFSGAAIRDRATGRAAIKRLDNVYYDTDDQRLRARGLAFRVRKDGRRFYQTLKSDDAAGLAAYRGEWQNPLRSGEPDLALMPEGGRAALDGAIDPDELRPVFATRVRRTVRRVETTDHAGRPSLIEAALDVGGIEANGASLPIAEVELELLEGSPEALYALALELDALAPLRLETRSKSARGYALAAGMPPAWHKAEPPALEADATVDRAIQAILRSCLQHWCANEAAALDGSDPEGVHQMRVALRRLRSAFSVFGRLIDPAQRAWLSDEAKTIVNGLGPARDWDVFLAELLAPVRAARQDDAGLSRLAAAAEAARAKSYARCARRNPGPHLHPLRSAVGTLDRSLRLARSADGTGRDLAGSADRRVRDPSARQATAQGVATRTAVRAVVGRGAPPAADRAQEAALCDRVLRGALSEKAHQAVPRGVEGLAGRSRPSE